MKKIFFVVFAFLLLFLVTSAFAQSEYVSDFPKKNKNEITYVQFNFCNLGEKKIQKNLEIQGKQYNVLEYSAKILAPADIIVIQEVSTSDWGARAVAKFADELSRTGAKWDYFVTDKTSGDGSERFAIVFKTSTVSFIVRNQSGLVNGLSDKMDREPGHFVLKIKGKNLDIYSYHLVPTNKKPENEANTVAQNKQLFTGEYVIMSGDFNLGSKKLAPYFENSLGLTHQIEGKTSLKSKQKGDEYLAQEYDNIFTNSRIRVTRTGIFDFVRNVGNLTEARKISDHLPVFIYFEMR